MSQAIQATILTTPDQMENIQANAKVLSSKKAPQLNLSYHEIEEKVKESGDRESWDPVFYIRADTSEIIEGRDLEIEKTTELIMIPSQLAEYYGWSQGIEFYYIEQECHFDLFTRDLLDYQHKLIYGGYEECDPQPYRKSEFQTIPEYIEYARENGYETIEDDWMEDIHNRLNFHINQWAEEIEKGSKTLKSKYIINWIE